MSMKIFDYLNVFHSMPNSLPDSGPISEWVANLYVTG